MGRLTVCRDCLRNSTTAAYVRLNRDRYLRIGWFAGAKPSPAAFRSECRSREVQGMIVFSPDSLTNQRDQNNHHKRTSHQFTHIARVQNAAKLTRLFCMAEISCAADGAGSLSGCCCQSFLSSSSFILAPPPPSSRKASSLRDAT